VAGTLEAAYDRLGLRRDADEAEVRAAYRRLAQLHHPDHNAGSREAAARFAEVQAAYARILEAHREAAAAVAAGSDHYADVNADLDARLARMERELQEARAVQAAAGAHAKRPAPPPPEPSPEELGYVTTEDSLSEIVGDLLRRLRGSAGP
jgi:DnaJ-domain-containing protein 1